MQPPHPARLTPFPVLCAAGLALAALVAPARAEEGMWLFSNPPRAQLKAAYNFDLTDAWLEHVMQSSVRFNNGGSGSFVSGDGLVITNHHVGLDVLQKVSTKENDYARDGFAAKDQAAEIPAVDLELNILQSIEDMTARVNSAVPPGAAGAATALARRKIFAEIEKESREKTGLRSDVVTLYQGGQYHLYRYKKYTDVRLVFAPDAAVAAFGGDPDNFEYPRYCLDVCFFRVYENGAPVKPAHFLKWSAAGAQDGELTFVSGHPGNTSRLLTVAELTYVRDSQVPAGLARLKRSEVLLTAWAARSAENDRRAHEDLLSIQNSRKNRDGGLAALQDPEFFAAKVAAERAFRQQLADRPGGIDALAALDRIAAATKTLAAMAVRNRALEGAFGGDSFGLARSLLRVADERSKPNGERLREYTDARRESFEQRLFSEKPIYADLEIVLLADSLTSLVEQLGADDPVVKTILAGQSPRVRAAALITGTRVRDVAFRKKLYAGDPAAVAAAQDPMIELARAIDPEARALRKSAETQNEIKQQAHAVLAAAHFALEGASSYPDATFTLRLSYGPVRGYEENGQKIPAMTTFAGLYARAAEQSNREPFNLPARWLERKAAIDPAVPFNFVSTPDIIGGNSGSPSVNRAGEFVGIIFDGNLQSLVGDYGYEDRQSRALSVHSAGILESLRKIYGQSKLVDELLTGKR